MNQEAGLRVNQVLSAAGMKGLEEEIAGKFGAYLGLIQRWNSRTNLTAIRDEEGILSRHFLECIACARVIPLGVSTLLDFGSGGGFPGIPIALCRPEIQVTLAESQGKKAAFLQEAVRVLGIQAVVFSGRAETIPTKFSCVAMRAVDRMEASTWEAAELVASGGYLVLMTSIHNLESIKLAAGDGFVWENPIPVPEKTESILVIGKKI